MTRRKVLSIITIHSLNSGIPEDGFGLTNEGFFFVAISKGGFRDDRKSVIFIFGNSGQSMPGSIAGIALSVPLTMFMMALELIVALVQAFVFTILTASYIGAATEEAHH